MAQVAEQNSTGDAREWWHKAYAQLSGMKQRGIMLPTDEQHLTALRQKAEELPEGSEFVPAGHPASARRGPASPPRVTQTPAITPQTMTPDELRASADDHFRHQRWELAQTYYTRLLDLGEPLMEVVPRLVDCLLNAHDELLPGPAARIEDLISRLESAGHADLARQLRATCTARLPKKPWWKLW